MATIASAHRVDSTRDPARFATFQVGIDVYGHADALDAGARIPGQSRCRVDPSRVRGHQGGAEALGMNPGPHGVGGRVEHR